MTKKSAAAFELRHTQTILDQARTAQAKGTPFSQCSEIMTRRRLLQRTLAFLLLATPAFGSLTHHLAARYSPDNTQLFNRELDRNLVDRELEGDDAAAADAAEAQALANEGDDGMFPNMDYDFDEVSVMPVSCVNYHNGHMIKYQLFEKSSSLNCHFKNLGTFVVSIAHYMRAYFNYQALTHGNEFRLPGDVGFLNCVMLKETANADVKLYAKIGCQHRDTYTSTKLQLIVYKDAQCSVPFQNSDDDARKDGYLVNNYFLSNKVSFRPNFYSCQSCLPDEISDTFSKRYSHWYDDDYISRMGQKQKYQDDGAVEVEEDYAGGNGTNATDDGAYYQANDDIYASQYNDADDAVSYNNDDAAAGDDGGNNKGANYYVNQDDGVYYNYAAHDDDFYNMNDDGANRRGLRNLEAVDASHSITAKATLKEYEAEFQRDLHRRLEESNSNVATWNMCERVHHYGVWCDDECRALDTFRVDEWSRSDVFLLVIMCVFMGAMMLLVFAKRVKAYERSAMWGDEPGAPDPGLPPCAMLLLFAIVFTVIIVLAALKFVNETLVVAVVTCILFFLYMLKLTLFESRKPQFIPTRGVRNSTLKEPIYLS